MRTLRIVRDESPVQVLPMTELSDETLVGLLAKKGDTQALGVLYDRHHRVVLNRAWGLVKEKSKAEDLTHDIFLKLFTHAGKYRPDAPFPAWFSVFSYHVVMDSLRERKLARFVELEEDRSMALAADDGSEAIQEKKLFEVRVEALMENLGALAVEDRSVLLMKYQDGLGVKEMSAILGIGESAVKMRLMRARQKILDRTTSL